jgi:NAD(P)H-hydrate epimerase
MLSVILDAKLPAVVDADALNLLAQEPVKREDWILTPHPGEAARLLGTTSQAIQADRFAAVRELQQQYGGVVLLKGAGTLIWAGEEPVGVCDYANPAMASGGMGDILTGVIAGLRAQRLGDARHNLLAARLGACVHASAAEWAAAESGERGLLATDLLPFLQDAVNPD